MSQQFETLRAYCSRLTDDHLDEDHSEVEVQVGDRTVRYQQRTVTARGKLEDVPVVVMYQKYFFYGFGDSRPAFTDVLELFTTARKLPVEATIRKANFWTKLKRLMGRGGIRGPHALYTVYEVQPLEGAFSPFPDALNDALLGLLQGSHALDFQLQSDTGFNGIYPWSTCSTVDALDRVVQQQLHDLASS